MFIYICSIFTSAFLIFQVQPMIARFILPWFGGTASVWSTCMLFFQLGLLAGYLYAYLISAKLSIKRQALLHMTLLLLALFLLPIEPTKPILSEISGGGHQQTLAILGLLFKTVGIPFVLLSASAPLLQHWFANHFPGRSPYRLYALSNVGSLLALLSYPFIIEPALTLSSQTWGWSIGFALYGAMILVCGVALVRASTTARGESSSHHSVDDNSSINSITDTNTDSITDTNTGNNTNSDTDSDTDSKNRVGVAELIKWIAYSACGSMLLLAVTNFLCQDVAVIPFLWVVPLSLYLISFIICFDRSAWYQRWFWMPLYLISMCLIVYLLMQDFQDEGWPLLAQIIICCSVLFTAVMVCHGELARSKPPVKHLTLYYLMISVGGAIGGFMVSFVAPLLVNGFWELHFNLVFVAVIITLVLFTPSETPLKKIRFGLGIPMSILTLLVAAQLLNHVVLTKEGSIYSSRGFYGVLYVYEYDAETEDHYRSLFHGRIRHGEQWLDKAHAHRATSYYVPQSGVGVAIEHHPNRVRGRGMHIGVIGLGVGTVAAYGEAKDRITFYEINDQVTDVAHQYFSYLGDSTAEIEVKSGDARLVLEKEAEEGDFQQFDLLVVDAFSGDSVPIHLLTQQAYELYEKHLKPDGILAIHITNRYVDLSNVTRTLADVNQKSIYYIEHEGDDNIYDEGSDWVLITNNELFLQRKIVQRKLDEWYDDYQKIHWTDDFSNLFEVFVF